jgi:hypothetical protein
LESHGFGYGQSRGLRSLLVSMIDPRPALIIVRARRAVAWPLYAISLIMDFASAALGSLAASIAGDDWPQ